MSETAKSRPLRSNLEPGVSPMWSARRALWRALGLTDEDMEKPKIAVVNTSSELAICFSHLDDVAERAKEAIRAAGGLPFEIRTAAPSDFITSLGKGGAYILSARDLIASDIEVQVEGALLDGMVCLASCDKSTPGQLMAAGRLDVPTLIIPCGYQQSGTYQGRHCDIEDVFLASSSVSTGGSSIEELRAMSDVAIQSPGVCAGMGTANSMHIAAEALGMALPGSAPVQANSSAMDDAVQRAGARIVEMVWEDVRPRQILTPGAFANAVKTVLALSASVNCVKHLQAIAMEAEVDVDVVSLFSELSTEIPLLAGIRPSGEDHIEDLEAGGGARSVMKRLEQHLDLTARNVDGRSIGEILEETVVPEGSVVRPMEDPVSRRPTLIIMQGSLLPGGGIVRVGGEGERATRVRGPVQIHHSREDANEAIRAGNVQPGDVIVLRGIGVRGGPGMAFTSGVVFALAGAGLIDEVAVITEGQVSGLVNRGIVVAEASPEAAEGGPLGLLNDGDMVTIDLDTRRVDHELDEAEVDARRAEGRTFGSPDQAGWLGIYRREAGPVHRGAVLGDRG